jgi:hypothetical protein
MAVRVFFDTEFTGLHQQAALISMGLISEDGRTFYGEFNDYPVEQTSAWVVEHVVPYLQYSHLASLTPPLDLQSHGMKASRSAIRTALETWLAQFDRVEMWADYPAYDWVLLADLFGGSLHLPRQVSSNAFDIATLLQVAGIDPTCDRRALCNLPNMNLHNALDDAKLAKACYEKVMTQVTAIGLGDPPSELGQR